MSSAKKKFLFQNAVALITFIIMIQAGIIQIVSK